MVYILSTDSRDDDAAHGKSSVRGESMQFRVSAKWIAAAIGVVAILVFSFSTLRAQRRFSGLFNDSFERQNAIDQSELVFARIQFGSGRRRFWRLWRLGPRLSQCGRTYPPGRQRGHRHQYPEDVLRHREAGQ